jgi:hypothetical protein
MEVTRTTLRTIARLNTKVCDVLYSSLRRRDVASGPSAISRDVRFLVAIRGKADERQTGENRRSWPLTSFTPLQKCCRNRINSRQTAPSGFTDSAAIDP